MCGQKDLPIVKCECIVFMDLNSFGTKHINSLFFLYVLYFSGFIFLVTYFLSVVFFFLSAIRSEFTSDVNS